MVTNNKGVAIFITLMLLFLLSLIAISTLLTAYNYNNICEAQASRLRALALAESGVHYAYWKIRIGEDDDGNPISYPCALHPGIPIPAGWSIQVDITDDDPHEIQSKVTYRKSEAE